MAERRAMIDLGHAHLSVVRQCQLLGLSRSSFYYRPQEALPLDWPLMHAIDRLYMQYPFYGRYVLAWRIDNTLDTAFCLAVLEEAQTRGRPEIFNTDQGPQFASVDFTKRVECVGVCMSMDGRGCWMDNVFIERLWCSLKYEDIYLNDYETGAATTQGKSDMLTFIATVTVISIFPLDK